MLFLLLNFVFRAHTRHLYTNNMVYCMKISFEFEELKITMLDFLAMITV